MVRLVTEVDQERRAALAARLKDYNTARSPSVRALRGRPEEHNEPLDVYAVDEDGALVAGLGGHTWGHWLHIDLLWVDEERRGAGLGTRLVRRAEDVARERSCGHARVESWDFQAPGFYERLGYRVVAVIPDYPPGITDHLLIRDLVGGE